MIQVRAINDKGDCVATLDATTILDALRVIRNDLVRETTNDTIDVLITVHDEVKDLGVCQLRSKDHSVTYEIRRVDALEYA